MIYIKKKLVIFLIATIPILLIYKITINKTYTYLSIGDDLAKGHTPFNTYNMSYTDYLYKYLKEQYPKIKLNKDFIEEDIRIKDLIIKITEPDLTKSKNLSQALKKADIITLSVGSDELFSKLRSNYTITNMNFFYIDELLKDTTTLLKEIRKITNKKIYIIGYYSPINETLENSSYITTLFNYIDTKYMDLETKYNVTYIRIDEEFRTNPLYLPNKTNAFPSLEGYKLISDKIIKKLES